MEIISWRLSSLPWPPPRSYVGPSSFHYFEQWSCHPKISNLKHEQNCARECWIDSTDQQQLPSQSLKNLHRQMKAWEPPMKWFFHGFLHHGVHAIVNLSKNRLLIVKKALMLISWTWARSQSCSTIPHQWLVYTLKCLSLNPTVSK